jgi:hypothetical protein
MHERTPPSTLLLLWSHGEGLVETGRLNCCVWPCLRVLFCVLYMYHWTVVCSFCAAVRRTLFKFRRLVEHLRYSHTVLEFGSLLTLHEFLRIKSVVLKSVTSTRLLLHSLIKGKGDVFPGAYRGTTPCRRMENGGISPRILNFDTRWRGAVSFTPQPLYLQGSKLGSYWVGSAVGRQSLSGRRETSCPVGNRTPAV